LDGIRLSLSYYRAASAIIAQRLTLLAEMLGMFLAPVGHVQTIGFFQRSLLARIHVYVTLDALLAHIGPAVGRHPLALALGTLVLAEAPMLALVRRQALALRSRLQNKLIRRQNPGRSFLALFSGLPRTVRSIRQRTQSVKVNWSALHWSWRNFITKFAHFFRRVNSAPKCVLWNVES